MSHKLSALSVTLVGLSFAIVAVAAEKKLSKADLPAPVQKAAEDQSKGATVLGYSSDREDGKLEYEVKMSVDGHSKDVTIAPDGSVLEVEEQVPMDKLSAPVKAGLLAKAGKGSIRKIESLTKHGTIVAYEAQVYTAGKHSEAQVGPDGKPLDHEE
jgi:hypothetical protein